MEEGQMRCDINISMIRKTDQTGGKRVEVKNVMGVRFVEKVIEHEMQRQSELIDQGLQVEHETRRFD